MKSLLFFGLILIYSCSNSQPQNFADNLTKDNNEDATNNSSVATSAQASNSATPTDGRKASAKTINLMSYGAKGLGVSSLKEDTIALRKAIADLNAAGGGVLYVPNPPKFYAFAGNAIYVGDNIEIYGDGKGKSEIRNVSPLSGTFLRGNIFMFSTYGPDDVNSIFQPGVDHYQIKDAKKGDQSVILLDKNNAASLSIGEVVVVGAGLFKHSGIDTKSRYHFMEENMITAINSSTVTFKYPISVPLGTDKQGDAPELVNINHAKSNNKSLGLINRTSKNAYIHDMSFTQAQSDEITNTPIDTTKLKTGLSGVWQPGGAFQSTFKNLYISNGGDLAGNMLTRCRLENIELHSPKKLVDFGYGSSNDTMMNIKWVYLDNAASNFAASFIIINDATHNIYLKNIDASGNWNGENLMLLSGTSGIYADGITYNFPNYKKNKAGVQIGDAEGAHSRDISLSNINISVNSISQFLRIAGQKDVQDLDRNINVSNCSFKGTIKVDQGIGNEKKTNNKIAKSVEDAQGVFVKNINGLKLEHITLTSGDLYMEDCNNSDVNNIVAPTADLTLAGSNSNTTYSNMNIRSKSVQGAANKRKRN